MAEDFYKNLISGFARGLGLGGNSAGDGIRRRRSRDEVDEITGLLGELTGSGAKEGEAPLPEKEALLAALSPAVFRVYEKYRASRKKTPGYDEPYLYYTDAEGNRTWLDDGAGGKVKNSFWKPKVVDRFNEYKDGKPRRVYLYEDGTKEYHDLEDPPPVKTNLDPEEYEKKLIEAYKAGRLSLKDLQILRERNRKRVNEIE